MRTCIVTSELAPYSGWGVGAAAAALARALADAGDDVHVLTDPAPALNADAVRSALGTTLHVLDSGAGDAALDHHPCRSTRRPLAILRHLRELQAAHGFESIHFNDFYGDAALVSDARRTLGEFEDAVLTVHLHSAILLLRRINGQIEADLEAAAVERLEVAAIRSADLLISPSNAMFEKLREIIGDLPARRAVIPYAFDPDRTFAAAHTPPPARPADEAPEVLFFGRLEWRKGVQFLAHAAQALLESGLDLRVRVIGTDTDTAPDRGSVRRWVHSRIAPCWRDRFIFEENRRREDLLPAIHAAAACCVPSLWENFPNVCLEAMSLGKVVVAAECGGIPEIIEHGRNGLLFRAGDPESLAAVLREALTDADLASRCASASPARIRQLCSPAETARRTAEAIQSARVAGPSHRGSVTLPTGDSRVSVVIPFYNLSRFLPGTIASVRAQSRAPDEIIIIDDGSTEAGAAALLARFESESIRVVRKQNGGLSSARNAGLAAATSRWVLPLDADDLLHPTFIERALLAARRDDSLTVITAFMKCFSESPERPEIAFVPFSADPVLLPVLNTASSAIALLDRCAALSAGGYDESFFAFEDWDLWCSLAARGARFAVIPEFLIYNRVRPGSMLRSLSTDQYHRLRAKLLAKHGKLSPDPQLTLRMMLAESMHYQNLYNGAKQLFPGADISEAVRRTVLATPRYRVADRLNDSLKRLGIHPLIKNLLGRTD